MENKEKKHRSSNWNSFDQELLKLLVLDKVSIVENSSSNVEASNMRRQAWEEICTRYNNLNPNLKGKDQLKAKWTTMKKASASAAADITFSVLPSNSLYTKDNSQMSQYSYELDKNQEQTQLSKNDIEKKNCPAASFRKPISSPINNFPMGWRNEYGVFNKVVEKTPNSFSEMRTSLQSDSISQQKYVVPHTPMRSSIERAEQTPEKAVQIRNHKEPNLKTRSPTKTRTETIVKPTDSKIISSVSVGEASLYNSPMTRIEDHEIVGDMYPNPCSSFMVNKRTSETKKPVVKCSPITNIFIKMETDIEEYQQRRQNSLPIIEQQPIDLTRSNSEVSRSSRKCSSLNNNADEESWEKSKSRSPTKTRSETVKKPTDPKLISLASDNEDLTIKKERIEDGNYSFLSGLLVNISTSEIITIEDSSSESEGDSCEKTVNILQKNNNVVDEELLNERRSSMQRAENKNKKMFKSSKALQTIAQKEQIQESEEQRMNNFKEREEKHDKILRQHSKESKTVTFLSPTSIKITNSTSDMQGFTSERSSMSNIVDNNRIIDKQQVHEQIPSSAKESEDFSNTSSNTTGNFPLERANAMENVGKSSATETVQKEDQYTNKTKNDGGIQNINVRQNSEAFFEEQPEQITRQDSVLQSVEDQSIKTTTRDSIREHTKKKVSFDSALNSAAEQSKQITKPNSVLNSFQEQPNTMTRQDSDLNRSEEQVTEFTTQNSNLNRVEDQWKKITRRNSVLRRFEEQQNKVEDTLNSLGEVLKSLTKQPKITTERDSSFSRVEEQQEERARFDSTLNIVENQSKQINRRNSVSKRYEEPQNKVKDQPAKVTAPNYILKRLGKQPKTMNKQESTLKRVGKQPKKSTKKGSDLNIVANKRTQKIRQNSVLKRAKKYQKPMVKAIKERKNTKSKSIKNDGEQIQKPPKKRRPYLKRAKSETVTPDKSHFTLPNLQVPESSSPITPSSMDSLRPGQCPYCKQYTLNTTEEQVQNPKRRRYSNKNAPETLSTAQPLLLVPNSNIQTTSSSSLPHPSIDSLRLGQCPECIRSTRTLNTTDGTTPDFFSLYETVRQLKVYIFKVQSIGMKQMSFIGEQVNEPQSWFYNSFERTDNNLLINKYRERLHFYDGKKFHQDNDPFFALYSQSCRPHLCNTSGISIIRKSEFHTKINNIKQHPKKKRKLMQTVHVIIYSFEDDLYLDLPQNSFWTKPNITLRLKKSINNNFNYILASRIALADVKIYGTYFVEYVYMGRSLEGEWEKNYDSKPFPIDCGFLHYSNGKNCSGDDMECACSIVDKSYSFKMPERRS